MICLMAAILAASAVSFVSFSGAVQDSEAKIVVMNPRGILPEIRKIPMAARQSTLDGKTVYIVDTKYPNTKPFIEELQAGLQGKYPKTNWVIREKLGSYFEDDPNLWKEAKEKADGGTIVGIGH
jgi:hypothetical protein